MRGGDLVGTLRNVVVSGLPLDELCGVGYSGRTCAAVVSALMAHPGKGSSMRELTTESGLSHATVRMVCRDLLELGHLHVSDGGVPGTRDWPSLRYRMSQEGVAVWRRRVDERDRLLRPVPQRPGTVGRVLGARLSGEQRGRGAAPGYGFASLERVVRALLDDLRRFRSTVELSAASGVASCTVGLACRDLVAVGYARRQAEFRTNGTPKSARYRLTAAGAAVWGDWFASGL
ncbi:hypothetical protein GCM10009660_08030 [Catellatospora bangladeshensis]